MNPIDLAASAACDRSVQRRESAPICIRHCTFALLACALAATSHADVLIVDNKPLSVVAAQLNLVNDGSKQIRVAESVTHRLGGILDSDRPDRLMVVIQEIWPDILVTKTERGWTVTKR